MIEVSDLVEKFQDAVREKNGFKISVIKKRLELLGYTIMVDTKEPTLLPLNNGTTRQLKEL